MGRRLAVTGMLLRGSFRADPEGGDGLHADLHTLVRRTGLVPGILADSLGGGNGQPLLLSGKVARRFTAGLTMLEGYGAGDGFAERVLQQASSGRRCCWNQLDPPNGDGGNRRPYQELGMQGEMTEETLLGTWRY